MDDYSVAVDVGGTFTDIVLCNLTTNEQQVHKTPSTPDDPSTGFLTGLREVLAANSVEASQVKHVFHGTTIATNAILENKGSPVGLVVSDGFKFVLEIGRHGTPRLVNPNSWVKPDRPVRPRDIVEVPERVGFDGEILAPLDEEAVRAAARGRRAALWRRAPLRRRLRGLAACCPARLRGRGPALRALLRRHAAGHPLVGLSVLLPRGREGFHEWVSL